MYAQTGVTGQAVQGGDGRHGEPLAMIMRGASVALLASLLGGGLGFVFLVVMARLMDQADFGLLVLALNLLLAATALGVAGADYATVRYVAAEASPGRKRGAIVTPLFLAMALNLTVSAVTFVFAEPIAADVLGQPRFEGALRALALVLPLTVAAQMFSAGLSGLERVRGELARKCVEQAGRIVLAPLGLALGLGLVGAVLGMAAAAAAAAVAVGYLLIRALPRGGKTERISPRKVMGFSWPQAIANIAGQSWEVANVVLLTHFSSPRTVALFGAALAIARLPALIYNSFAFRFSPAISRLWERGDRDQLRELLKSVTRWVAIFAVPLYAVAIALPASLLLLYGERYQEGATVLALVAAGSLLNSIAGPVETALIMTGRVKLEMAGNVVAAVVMVALALVLIPRYGLLGAGLATLGYSILLNALKSLFVLRALGMVTLSPSLLGPLLAGAAAAAATLALDAATDLGSSLAGTVVLGLVLLGAYALVLLRLVGIGEADRRTFALALRAAR